MTDIWQKRQSVFKQSYDEVLAALKHQDDKLNRTLTAIAFLTAAGVALYTRVGPTTGLHFAESSIDIRGFFFVVFLLSLVIAVTLALSAIGPSASYTRLGTGARDRDRDRSLIFYASISRDPKWGEYIGWDAARLEKHLAENLHREALKIAQRIDYKVARSRESGAFVLLTVVSLSLLGIFSVETFSVSTRWWLAVSLLLVLLLLPFFDLWHMLLWKFTYPNPAWWTYALLLASLLWAALLLGLAQSRGIHWPATIYALTVVVCSRLAIVHKHHARLLLAGSALAGLDLVIVFVCGAW